MKKRKKKAASRGRAKPRTRYFIAGSKPLPGSISYLRVCGKECTAVRWDRTQLLTTTASAFGLKGPRLKEVTAKEAHAERRRLEALAKTSGYETLAAAAQQTPGKVVPARTTRSHVPTLRLPLLWLATALTYTAEGAVRCAAFLIRVATRGWLDTVTVQHTSRARTAARA